MAIPIPQRFIERMTSQIGKEQTQELVKSLTATSRPKSLRLNPYKSGLIKPTLLPVPWCKYGYYVEPERNFTTDPAFAGGGYYVQEAASQFIEYILRGQSMEGKIVFDLCAAPGGKTTLYSTLVGKSGLVVANEYVKNRATILADNAKKWGVGNIVVTTCDTSLIGSFKGVADIVAVDAPCSGEGMFGKDEGARKEWSEDNIALCATRQREILENVWSILRYGGLLIYSTCTFNRTENEDMLSWLLSKVGEQNLAEVDIEPTQQQWGIVEGRVGPFKTFRFFPHLTDSEGLFIAIARKTEQCITTIPKPKRTIMATTTKAESQTLSRWIEDSSDIEFFNIGGTYYGVNMQKSEIIKAIAHFLPTIYCGVCLGQIFKNELKPDWALSQYCRLNRKNTNVVELDMGSAIDYLRKGNISVEQFTQGLNLVTCNGYALGYIKRIGNRCNNGYPNNLRILHL